MLMLSDFKILSMWFVIEYWWYNTLTRENNWFLNVFGEVKFCNPTPFGRVSFFVVGICLSNYNLNSFLIHETSYSKGYQCYFMHREVLGSIWPYQSVRGPLRDSIELESWHEISNVVCVTSIVSDQPAHTRSLIRAFASRLNILWVLSYWLTIIRSFSA